MIRIDFTVPGTPVPQGSMRHVGNGRVVHGNEATLKPWRVMIAAAAMEAMQGAPPTAGLVAVSLVAHFSRPKCHYGTGRNLGLLKRGAPWYHTVKPDGDKLLRAVLDALTGICYRDDSQVHDGSYRKRWTTGAPRIEVTVLF